MTDLYGDELKKRAVRMMKEERDNMEKIAKKLKKPDYRTERELFP